MSDPAWAPFVGFGALVALAVVALSRVSAAAVTDRSDGTDGTDGVDSEPGPTGRPPISPAALLANVLFTQGLVGAVVLGTAWAWSIPFDAIGLGAGDLSVAALAVGVGTGVALALGNQALSVVCERLGVPYSEALREALTPESVGGWVVLLAGVLPIAAAAEELLFRGVLVGAVAAGFAVSPWALAVLSSALFGAAHSAQGNVGVAVAALLGFALAALYVATGSLFVVIVAHYVVNAAEFLGNEAWA